MRDYTIFIPEYIAAGAAIGGIVIAALTVIATNQRITPDTIRTE